MIFDVDVIANESGKALVEGCARSKCIVVRYVDLVFSLSFLLSVLSALFADALGHVRLVSGGPSFSGGRAQSISPPLPSLPSPLRTQPRRAKQSTVARLDHQLHINSLIHCSLPVSK